MDTNANVGRMKTVYTVVERGPGRAFWVKLGVGFVNHDGSINLRLDAVPVNGTLQVRDYEPPTEVDRRNSETEGESGRVRGRRGDTAEARA